MLIDTVIFEMFGQYFTLSGLQNAVEGIFGHRVHNQNLRRFFERGRQVTKTNKKTALALGRPASLFKVNTNIIDNPNALGIPFKWNNTSF